MNSNPENSQSAALIEGWHELQIARGVKGFTVADMLRELRDDSTGKEYQTLRDCARRIVLSNQAGRTPVFGFSRHEDPGH